MSTISENFNPQTVYLNGSNLIEASAGTGKTYSIALMALRLIVENNIPIQNILMVTFTKAAVAELELRVRSFVRLALKASLGKPIPDQTIQHWIGECIGQMGQDTVSKRLYEAQLFLDETSVLTIHSFCQKVLGEYAFETGQVFGATAMSPDDANTVVEDSFHEFWRKQITTLPTELLVILLKNGLSMEALLSQVKDALNGKISIAQFNFPKDFLKESYIGQVCQLIKGDTNKLSEQYHSLVAFLETNSGEIIPRVSKNRYANNVFLESFNNRDWDTIIKNIHEKVDSKYIATVFDGFEKLVEDYYLFEKSLGQYPKVFILHLGIAATQQVLEDLQEFKRSHAVITFDDMIELLYLALKDENRAKGLVEALRKKYQAVFIDEFQDTDKKQYAIFKSLFGHDDHILFYIGDPKQSIYGFRSADIHTYFEAKKEVERVHLMNVNHRSSEGFISAMNNFFLPQPDFDTFFNNKSGGMTIDYIPVTSPSPNERGDLQYQGGTVTPIHISAFKNRGEMGEGVKNVAVDLLFSKRYTIHKKGEGKPVRPADIGILVRTKNEGAAIKEMLAKHNIAAITISDDKLLTSAEAKELYYVMLSVLDITRSNINRALLTSLGGYTLNKLKTANEEDILERFRKYQEAWKTDGVYVMLRKFLADHDFINILTVTKEENAERTVSNVFQLVEIVHKVSQRKKFTQEEQVTWLLKATEGRVGEGDEFEQRIESDEEAVKIVTIHKSKGLEYNIVLAPHLDMLSDPPHIKTVTFRNPIDGNYYTGPKDMLSLVEDGEKLYKGQNEQENSRLLYVAITRARYHCFIASNEASYYKNSVLKRFLNAIPKSEMPNNGISDCAPTAPEIQDGADNQPKELVRHYPPIPELHLTHPNWTKASYTMLSPLHETAPTVRYTAQNEDPYNEFVFRDLKKGAITGNLLHFLFENIDFSRPEQWQAVLDRAMKRATSLQAKQANIRQGIETMLHITTHIHPIPDSPFSLSQLKREDRVNELEFNFPLSPHKTQSIEALSTPNIPLKINKYDALEGIMNGKVDLLFEYCGKYYILDWKSNYLGPTVDNYQQDGVLHAMAENNYHLQYHLYTLAVCKYLKLRKPGFDYQNDFGGVVYLFLRGLRLDNQTGVFFHKPSETVINAMTSIFKNGFLY